MKRVWSTILVALLMLAFCGTAFAWAPRVEGRPGAFAPGQSRGYFIWHDANGLHMWTTTRGQQHRFSGVIRTDGRLTDIRGRQLENDDRFRVGPQRHELKFDFETAGGEDGVNFRIEGGDRVTFDLFIDGHRVSPREIHIGDRGWHPEGSEFTLHR